MPKLILINSVCSGSHGRIMADLSSAARARGYETVCAFARGEGEGLRIGGRADVAIHALLTRALDRHARGSRRATRAFVETLRAEKPDVIHLHNLHGYYLHAETFFRYVRESGVPVIWSQHDCWAVTGHCSHFVRADCDRWKTGCYDCPLRGEYPASRFADASRQNWQWKKKAFTGIPNLRLATPSEWMAGILRESFLKDYPLSVIPNGVDISRFTPGEKPTNAMPKLLAVAYPFDARKGYADALRLGERLRGRAELTLVGLSDRQLRDLPPYVCGLPRTGSPEALLSLFRSADCLINTTYEDTYPTVNMEAAACGTPVACYAVGGCPEQVGPDCGACVPCGDVAALAETALRLCANPPDARAAAVARFDRRKAMDAYVKLYDEVCKR